MSVIIGKAASRVPHGIVIFIQALSWFIRNLRAMQTLREICKRTPRIVFDYINRTWRDRCRVVVMCICILKAAILSAARSRGLKIWTITVDLRNRTALSTRQLWSSSQARLPYWIRFVRRHCWVAVLQQDTNLIGTIFRRCDKSPWVKKLVADHSTFELLVQTIW